MTSLTRSAIKASLWKILQKKPLAKITVRDIVEDCGINRNTFYYHFEDIPALINESVQEQAERIIAENSGDSMEACLHDILRLMMEKKKEILNIYNSINREVMERHIMQLCEFAAEKYFDVYHTEIKAEDKKFLISFVKREFFGLYIEWMNDGMKDEIFDVSCQILGLLEKCIVQRAWEK